MKDLLSFEDERYSYSDFKESWISVKVWAGTCRTETKKKERKNSGLQRELDLSKYGLGPGTSHVETKKKERQNSGKVTKKKIREHVKIQKLRFR